MNYIFDGIKEALRLLVGLDAEIYKIILFSIMLSFSATLIAAMLGIPIGMFAGLHHFIGEKIFARVIHTLMSIPPVVVGLLVALFVSRRGPLRDLELMFTPTAMLIAQLLLVLPIIIGHVYHQVKERGRLIYEVAITLGSNRFERGCFMIRELRTDMMLALVSGFGRAISEVGAVMIVGGNIKGYTRVMTTYIAMNNNMGKYASSIAMGIVLLLLSFLLNSILYHFVEREKE